jgi:hypothetical protein
MKWQGKSFTPEPDSQLWLATAGEEFSLLRPHNATPALLQY